MFDIRESGSAPGGTIPAPRTPEEKQQQQQRDQADDLETFRPRKWVVEPADWIRYFREHTAA